MDILTNKTFGNYTTLDYLGCGSFSAVYSAVHNYTKEKVALKVAHTNDRKLIEEYNQIVKTGLSGLLKINHQNIIGIREYFMTSDHDTDYFILVLDLIKGQSLDKTPGIESLSIPDKLNLFTKICNAIHFAHEFEYLDQNEFHSFKVKGILHGDIKPNNIMISPDWEPKIIDFLFLNFKKSTEEQLETYGNKEVNTGIFGTKGFMAPEQEKSGIINEKTDIFSLGILLKQIIYGFKNEEQKSISAIQLKLNKIIDKATHTNPAYRYNAVTEIIKDVNKLKNPVLQHKKWLSIAAACLVITVGLVLFKMHPSTLETNSSESLDLSRNEQPNELRGIKEKYGTHDEIDIAKNKYFALLIGNNDYQYWKKLEYPINDIHQMEKTLIENYTFEKENVKVVENGNYDKIYKSLESFTESGPNTFLLIYYAGHGKYDTETDKAALIPVDAEKNSDSKNLTSDLIKDLLKKSKIHNILFISDACYLGAMASRNEDSDSLTKPDVITFKSFASKQSRKFISSGARETVPDKSYFNEYLIKYLNNNKKDITFEYNIYNDIIEPIRRNSLTTPVYGIFFDTKDEGGHFYFIRRHK